MNRKTLLNWRPLVVFGLIFFTGLRPFVLGAAQRTLPATDLGRADAPVAPAAPLPPPFDSQTIPTTNILSPDGRVAARYEGMVDYNTPNFRTALERLTMRQ